MTAKKKILFVLTNHDRLGAAGDGSADPTGFHLSEAAHPWSILTSAGFEVDIVTPAGGKAPVDPSSRDLDDEVNVRFLADEGVKQAIADSPPLTGVDLSDYEAIYFPGGHGTMWDLPASAAVNAAVLRMVQDGKVVGAVCHGPAALVNVKLADGRWLVDGKTISVFTDDEEVATSKDTLMPFMLASRLEERGAHLASAPNFEKAVSVDGRLVTGQNPASARGVGEAIRDLVRANVSNAA